MKLFLPDIRYICIMGTSEKIKEINDLFQVGGDRFVNMVHAMAVEYRKSNEGDWWDDLSKKEQSDIDKSLAQLERGDTYSHEEAMTRMQKKYPQLNF